MKKAVLSVVAALSFATSISAINAEEVTIDNVDTMEGALLECSPSMDGVLALRSSNPEMRRILSLVKREHYFFVSDSVTYFSTAANEHVEANVDALELVRMSYFFNGKPVYDFVQDEEREKTQAGYDMIKQALDEALKKKACLNWKL